MYGSDGYVWLDPMAGTCSIFSSDGRVETHGGRTAAVVSTQRTTEGARKIAVFSALLPARSRRTFIDQPVAGEK